MSYLRRYLAKIVIFTAMQSSEITVIISTYNQPEWLGKVLFGYECQRIKNFQVIVADDGSTEDTKKLVQEFSKRVHYSLKHIWHEDQGFRKTVILNKAIVVAELVTESRIEIFV